MDTMWPVGDINRRRTTIAESTNGNIVVVKGLKKYFPNHKGFFNRIVNYTKAVNGVDFFITFSSYTAALIFVDPRSIPIR